jgi:N-acetylglucosaminyldiphosphoundecaprenol N-acetyl-beta-D-mannosaminyltransferase
MIQRLLRLNISRISYSAALEKLVYLAVRKEPGTACFCNVHMCVEAWDHPEVEQAVNGATFVFADGAPVAKAVSWISGQPQERIAGMDIIEPLLRSFNNKGLRLFVLGGSEQTQSVLKQRWPLEFPHLQVEGFSPPFRSWTEADYFEMENRIMTFDPHAVFVILGCPKQERWMHQMKNRVPRLLLALGGALPTVLGLQKRAPVWMQKLMLEWIYRLIQEPGRLWRRYFYTNLKFVWLFFRIHVVGRR